MKQGKIIYCRDPNLEPDEIAFAMITSRYISYPPQVVDGIKELMHHRELEIGQELETLGVTGIEESPRR
jgi:hypothetical protein